MVVVDLWRCGRVGLVSLALSGSVVWADFSEWLEPHPGGLSDPHGRQRAVEGLRAQSREAREAARDRGEALGLDLRRERPDGEVRELVAFEESERPLYLMTHNSAAAISSGAAELLEMPEGLSGAGFAIGIWDAGMVRSSHREFGSRVTLEESGESVDHATHVAGTLIASGVTERARGMSPAAELVSYDWTDDMAEVTARAASYPGEVGMLPIANFSYGYTVGWYASDGEADWVWYGAGSTASGEEAAFGRYDSYAAEIDELAYHAPYFLMFRSAGNDRADNPEAGEVVALSSVQPATVSYDPEQHPAGDGVYRSGYETISRAALGKNVLTVGAVGDVVANSARDLSGASMPSFSNWGPTDDGRIKPDLVSNGVGLYSPIATGDSSYGTYSGTSMASPSAAGSALLLVELYDQLFSGQAMRASTLKGLLLHTADDLGNAGPDYQYGWGLINVARAADFLRALAAAPESGGLLEDRLTSEITVRSYAFTSDGFTPLRVTLSWTDPAGSATSFSDSRSARLVHDLDLVLVDPVGGRHLPYTMPFVGTWSEASLSSPAVAGENHVDNVEQVYLAVPPAAGTYHVEVGLTGALSEEAQVFSLLVEGGVATAVPSLALDGVEPGSLPAADALLSLDLEGAGWLPGSTVTLERSGGASIALEHLEVERNRLRGRLIPGELEAGSWDLRITSPDGQSVLSRAALHIAESFWTEDFESEAEDWAVAVSRGSSHWVLGTSDPYAGATAILAQPPSTRNTEHLLSPEIEIPAEATDLFLSFWHQYTLEEGNDGGRLELSVDGGSWSEVTAATGGATFLQGGYDAVLNGGRSGSDLANTEAWTGDSGGYLPVVVRFTESDALAGRTVQFRWTLATNQGVASDGWWIDEVALSGTLSVASYDDWALQWFAASAVEQGSGAAASDPDGDGYSNYLEYALGLDPLALNAPPVLMLAEGTLTFRSERAAVIEGVDYVVEVSSDLEDWAALPQSEPESAEEGAPIIATMDAMSEADRPYFFRLRVESIDE